MPKKFPYAKYDRTDEGFEVYCVTDDWDFGEYNPTFHHHLINFYPYRKYHGTTIEEWIHNIGA